VNKCSAVADMGDRLTTIDMGQKLSKIYDTLVAVTDRTARQTTVC